MATFRPQNDVLARNIGGETVLVHLVTDRIFTLNRTGSRCWALLSEGKSRREITELMLQEFDVGRPELEQEIEDLLHSLIEAELLVSDG